MAYNIKDSGKISDHRPTLSKTYKISRIKDLPDSDKPREKLLAGGPGTLSATELLAVVLGVGTKKEEVFSMSSRLLREYGEKAIIHQKDPKAISRELKIPESKACQIVACFELGRRFFLKTPGGSITIRNAAAAFAHLKDMGLLQKEQFRGLYLNSRYQLVHDEVISLGTLTSSLVHPREVFKPALEYSAVAVIIAHNHPSGSLKATRADQEITKQLIEAGEILEIEILDHLIIAKNKYTSIL